MATTTLVDILLKDGDSTRAVQHVMQCVVCVCVSECVCVRERVCVCERERGREKEREGGRKRESECVSVYVIHTTHAHTHTTHAKN